MYISYIYTILARLIIRGDLKCKEIMYFIFTWTRFIRAFTLFLYMDEMIDLFQIVKNYFKQAMETIKNVSFHKT